jgi:hypothetical protein
MDTRSAGRAARPFTRAGRLPECTQDLASLRMLAGLGELQSDRAGGSCDVVVRVTCRQSTTTADAA